MSEFTFNFKSPMRPLRLKDDTCKIISTLSCIILPANAHTFIIKLGMLQSLPTFHGMESESPYLHVKEFEEMVGTMVDGPQIKERIQPDLNFFLFN